MRPIVYARSSRILNETYKVYRALLSGGADDKNLHLKCRTARVDEKIPMIVEFARIPMRVDCLLASR